jgi:hypothetical protein
MAVKLLVTGGYFDEGADGVIHHVELDSGRVETWARWQPPAELAVPTKGFAGARRDATRLWVAAHAAVVRFDLATARVDGVLHQPDFNDLHDVALDDGDLLIANTGSDAVERVSRAGVFIGRHSWLPAWAQARRMQGQISDDLERACEVGWTGAAPTWVPGEGHAGYHSHASERARAPYHRTKVVDRVHPNHLVRVEGEWLATCLYDGSVRALADSRSRLRVPGHPHDGIVEDGQLWLTTIDGGIWRAPLPLASNEPQRVAEVFAPGRVGWCRGLLLTPELIVVGLTEVRRERLPRHRWADADPRESVTGLVVLERRGYAQVGFVDLTDRGRHHKIYSILEAP